MHVHTRWSDGWWEIGPLAERACELGLAGIAITDHDEIRGGFALADYCARRGLPLDVLPGCEVTALEGGRDVHVIGVDLQEEVRPWQSVSATVDCIVAQGGIPVMPHPRSTQGTGGPTFDQILSLDVPVAIETYNAAQDDLRILWKMIGKSDLNNEAREFYLRHRDVLLGSTGGTDAHFRSVGRGLTVYQGDLREALETGTTGAAFIPERERLRPHDPIGYVTGLRRLGLRRSERWGERPGDAPQTALRQKLARLKA